MGKIARVRKARALTRAPRTPMLRRVPASVSPSRAWAVTLVATATMAISYLDRQVLGVLAPSVRAELQIDGEAYGWLASSFSIAYLVSTPIAGRLLDRVGVRRGLLGAVILWSIVSASHGLATSFAMLFAMRLALGVTESPSFPGAAASISRALPPEQRPRGLGVLYTGTSLGAMIAPPLATFLAASLGGWRFGFLGVAIVGLVWVPLWLLATQPAAVRALLDSPPEARRTSFLELARNRAVLRAGALVLASSPTFAFFFLFSSLYLNEAHRVAQEDVGDFLWLPPLFLDVGAVTFGFLAARHARLHGAGRSPIALAAVALAMTAAIGALPLCPGPWEATMLFGLVLAGGGGLFAILTADLVTGVGPQLAASAGGLTAASQSIAYVIASPLIGRSADATGSHDLAVVVLACCLVPGFAAWVALRPR